MVKKTKKKSVKIDFEKEKRNDKNTIIAIAIIIAVVATLVVVVYVLNQTPVSSSQAAIIDGIMCDDARYDNFHINAHLNVFIDGQPYVVPEKIGVVNNTCLYWINTSDTTGIIHIETPNDEQFTLNQLFDIWKATGSSLPSHGTPTIYMNGQQMTSNLNDTVIKSHDEITVVYGDRPSVIPAIYQFPPGL
ncbi:MAG: hypothetical protein ACREBB_10705 [Nitrosotalea sp.]